MYRPSRIQLATVGDLKVAVAASGIEATVLEIALDEGVGGLLQYDERLADVLCRPGTTDEAVD